MFDETVRLAVHGRFINKETGALESHFLKVMDVLGPEITSVNSEEQQTLRMLSQ